MKTSSPEFTVPPPPDEVASAADVAAAPAAISSQGPARRWILNPCRAEEAAALARTAGIPPIVAEPLKKETNEEKIKDRPNNAVAS